MPWGSCGDFASMSDEEKDGIRGDGLADDAA